MHVVQACPAGSAQWQLQGPAEDGRGAASGCDARSWGGLDEDAATCSQQVQSLLAIIKVGQGSSKQFVFVVIRIMITYVVLGINFVTDH